MPWETVPGPTPGKVLYVNTETNEKVDVDYSDWTRVEPPDGGAAYWVCTSTGQSAWERPGWNTAVNDTDGSTFYYNSITKVTTTEKPAELLGTGDSVDPGSTSPPPAAATAAKASHAVAASADDTAEAAKHQAGSVAVANKTRLVTIDFEESDDDEPAPPRPAARSVPHLQTRLSDLKASSGMPPISPISAPGQRSGAGGAAGGSRLRAATVAAPPAPPRAAKDPFDSLFKHYKKTYLNHTTFSRAPMLANLSPQDETLIGSLFRLKMYHAGDVLYEQGELCDSVFVVCRGLVALMEDDGAGSETCVAHVMPGDICSAEGMLNEAFASPYRAIAYDPADADPDDTTYAEVGGFHALVMSNEELTAKIGGHWFMDRKKLLLRSNPQNLSLFLEDIPFFESIDESHMIQLCGIGIVRQYVAQHTIVSEGSPGDGFYLIVHGTVQVSVRGRVSAELGQGRYFGETALVKNIPTNASVRTKTPSLILCIDRSTFLGFLDSVPSSVKDVISHHIEHCTVVNFQAMNVPLLQGLDASRLEILARAVTFRVLHQGDVLFEAGALEDTAYLITQGVVEVSTTDSSGTASLSHFGTGSIVGREALSQMTPRPRPGKAVMVTSGVVVQIAQRDVYGMFHDDDTQLARFELLAAGESATLANLLSHPAAKEEFLQYAGDKTILPGVPEFLRSVRELNQAISAVQLQELAPSGGVPATPELVAKADLILSTHFSESSSVSSLSRCLSPPDNLAIRTSVEALKAGGAVLTRSLFDRAVQGVEESAKTALTEFKLTPMFGRMLRSFQTSISPRPEDVSKRGLSMRIRCAKLNRYGKWQGRAVQFNQDSRELLVLASPDSTSVAHTFSLLSVRRIERASRDDKQLRISFRIPNTRDYTLRFDDPVDREQFCILAHVLEPDLVFAEDCYWVEDRLAFYDVMMTTKGANTRRILSIDLTARTLSRRNPTKPDSSPKVCAIDENLRIETVPGSGNRLRVCIGPKARRVTQEYIFPTASVRSRFMGQISLLSYNIDPCKGRVLGLRSAGYPTPTLDVFSGTFNAGEGKPPSDPAVLSRWIPSRKFDVYAIGLQECSAKDEWIRAISTFLSAEETVPSDAPQGPSFGFADEGVLCSDESGPLPRPGLKPQDVVAKLPTSTEPYVLVASGTLWQIHLIVFARASVHEDISSVQVNTEATGIGGVMGNKGGVAIGFEYKCSTRIAFVTAHLAARATRLAQRAANYSEICRNISIGDRKLQLLHSYDFVFWAGDLNYRTDFGRCGTEREYAKVQRLVQSHEYEMLTRADQLKKELSSGKPFAGFREPPIKFPPTYRMVKNGGDMEYSNKKNQNASYTDRVLVRAGGGLDKLVSTLFYGCEPSLNISDHRPVSAGFRVNALRPYVNLGKATAFMNHGNCLVSLPIVRFSEDILAPAELDFAAAGLAEKEKGTSSRSRGAAPESKLDADDSLLLVITAPFLTEDVVSGLAPVSLAPSGARTLWTADLLPDISPFIPDAGWLKSQHFVVTIRRKSGAVVGYAELPLEHAYSCLVANINPDHLSLATVLEHPYLSGMWRAHVERELSTENMDFYTAARNYQTWASSDKATPELVKQQALLIMQRFISPSAPDAVNIPSLILRSLQTAVKEEKFTPHMFSEAQSEIFRLMDRDSFNSRFLPAFRKRYEDIQAHGGGAPFCVQVVLHGLKVGTLRGQCKMSSLDIMTELDERLKMMETFNERRKSGRVKSAKELLMSIEPTEKPATASTSGIDVDSDEDEDLMAELLSAGPSGAVTSAAGGPAAGAGGAVSGDGRDPLQRAVQAALAKTGGSPEERHLRDLLRQVYARLPSD